MSAKTHTLIDTAILISFVSKEFVMADGFYEDCKTASKLALRVAIGQHISMTRVFGPSVFTLDGHEIVDL